MGFLQRLDQSPTFHVLLRWLRVKELAGAALKRFPVVKTLPGSGTCYRCRYLETFVGADEIFGRQLYTAAIDAKTVTTFVDLGCNVGLFAAMLAHVTGRKDLQGIMIDANPEMVEETRWLLATNELDRVVAIHGLVGASSGGESAEFYLSTSNLGSSQYAIDEPGKSKKSAWTKTLVPRINLEEAWKKHFGDLRCHVLKVDIEGSEADLFKDDNPFFRRVDVIVLEWHKWIVQTQEMHALLLRRGFTLAKVLEETDSTGVGWYRRGD